MMLLFQKYKFNKQPPIYFKKIEKEFGEKMRRLYGFNGDKGAKN